MLHVVDSILSFCAKGEDADMASGGNLLLAKTGITPKANIDMALWGITSPEGPCCFQEPSAPERVATRKTVREEGSAIRTVQAWRGHHDENFSTPTASRSCTRPVEPSRRHRFVSHCQLQTRSRPLRADLVRPQGTFTFILAFVTHSMARSSP